MKLALHGATGRMGIAVAQVTRDADDLQIVGAVCAANDPGVGKDFGLLAGIGNIGVECSPDVSSGLLGADVVIDFTIASALPALLHAAGKHGVGVVTGTTNLGEKEQALLEATAHKVPVLWAPNMSLGVQVLAEVVEQALRRLGLDYDAEIVEIHHRRKVDSPSGTAKRLARAVKAVRPDSEELHGRDGEVGARTDNEVAVFGVRGGDVVGDHTVYLLGPGERLELTHRATNRGLFAHGAVRAARFLAGKPAGQYTIADVLGG